LQSELDRFRDVIDGRVIVLCHHNADPDALGAAQGVKELVEALTGSEPIIVIPDDASVLSRNIASMLGIELHETTAQEADTYIVVDTGSLSQLGGWEIPLKEADARIVFIDHHLPNSEMYELSNLYLVDPDASSASELVYKLYMHYGVTPTEITSTALLAGITYDTKHFSMGGTETFQIISSLLEEVGDVSKIKELLSVPHKQSEKIARLRAGQRAEIEIVGDWVLAFSRLSSFQSSGARALLSLGADAAVVVGEDKGMLRASFRSKNQFHRLTGVHLGEVAGTLASRFSGSGSGHPTAAGFNGEGDMEDFMEYVKKLFLDELNRLEYPSKVL
jgi:nanoRNase/pAp phosphatase (c-di-AMP/oligoRNAs hydrolase)